MRNLNKTFDYATWKAMHAQMRKAFSDSVQAVCEVIEQGSRTATIVLQNQIVPAITTTITTTVHAKMLLAQKRKTRLSVCAEREFRLLNICFFSTDTTVYLLILNISALYKRMTKLPSAYGTSA